MRKIIFVFLLVTTQIFAMQNPSIAQPDSVQVDIAQGEQQLLHWQAEHEKREMQSQFAKTKRDLNCWVWTCTASTAGAGLAALGLLAAYLNCSTPH